MEQTKIVLCDTDVLIEFYRGNPEIVTELKKMADIFGVSVDYLVSGNTEEKAKAILNDSKLLQLLKAVENLNDNDKYIISELISTFVFQRETQKRLAI